MSGLIVFAGLQGSTGLLAERELQAALAICSGLSGKEAARAMNCAPGTVKKTVERIFYKLGVSNRASMVTEVFKRGLISPAAVLALILAAHGALAVDPMTRVRRNCGTKIETRIAARRVEASLAA
ncbi:response regulator transcription factor [Pseudomonas coronafaciens]|uniref:response regulator transcription factor n=1 Tax=Pseudomonas coronafaciens TaxID=53409 RepID=UPI001604BF48|nr:LuxR C-terminal-related transcriptional regulator [Pseudomonas coronafaciens]